MALWTIVVIAALLTIAKIRILGFYGDVRDPAALLDIKIPGDLLAAMGIAAASTAAAPAILALKAAQAPPNQDQVAAAHQRVADTTSTNVSDITSTGQAVGRTNRDAASWLDLVTG